MKFKSKKKFSKKKLLQKRNKALIVENDRLVSQRTVMVQNVGIAIENLEKLREI